MFAKNERGYRLMAINKRFWSLLILLLLVTSIRRKLIKTTYTKKRRVHKNLESCKFNSDRKIINLNPNKLFRYNNNFSTHPYKVDILWKTFTPVLRIFDNGDNIFIFSRIVWNPCTSEILLKKKIKTVININFIWMRKK